MVYLVEDGLDVEDPKWRPSKYRPDHHPEAIVAYFRGALDAAEEPERVKSGGVRWIQRPVRPPTLAGYAARAGVGRETLWAWAQKDPEFAEALGLAQTIQEDLWIVLGPFGVYDFRVAKFVLEKLLRWTDHVEHTRAGGITLRFESAPRTCA